MRRRAAFALAIGLLALPAGAAKPEPASSHPVSATTADLTVEITGLRNAKGEVRLCVTEESDFLDCADDPAALTAEMPTREVKPVTFEAMPVGTYAVLVMHDENANGKLDTMLGIPKEGFGFSGNPKIRMGPPKARSVRFQLSPETAEQHVKVKYLL